MSVGGFYNIYNGVYELASGYNFMYGTWKSYAKRPSWQHGWEVGLYSQYIHDIYVIPYNVSYKHRIGTNSSLRYHVGPFLSLTFATNSGFADYRYFLDYYEEAEFLDIIDLGLKLGISYQYKRFMFDVSLLPTALDNISGDYINPPFKFTVGWNF